MSIKRGQSQEVATLVKYLSWTREDPSSDPQPLSLKGELGMLAS